MAKGPPNKESPYLPSLETPGPHIARDPMSHRHQFKEPHRLENRIRKLKH